MDRIIGDGTIGGKDETQPGSRNQVHVAWNGSQEEDNDQDPEFPIVDDGFLDPRFLSLLGFGILLFFLFFLNFEGLDVFGFFLSNIFIGRWRFNRGNVGLFLPSFQLDRVIGVFTLDFVVNFFKVT